MSATRLKSNVVNVLSSSAINALSFKIAGNLITPQHFITVRNHIKKDEIRLVADSGALAREGATVNASYNKLDDKMTLHSRIATASSVERLNRLQIIHECFHAICDAYKLQGITTFEEETCGYLSSALYELYHYNSSMYASDHPMRTLLVSLYKGKPRVELRGDPHFEKCFKRCYDMYMAADPNYKQDRASNNGIRKKK